MSGRLRRAAVMTALVGCVLVAPGAMASAAWAESAPAATPMAEPTGSPSAEPSGTPVAESSGSGTPEPTPGTAEPTASDPSPAVTEPPNAAPGDSPCGTPGPDGIDPCIRYSTSGAPGGVVEKETTPTLPLTGLRVDATLLGAGVLVALLGAASARRRRT